MIKIPIDSIISRIKEETNLSEEDISTKIDEKMKALSGLISKEGAAHIIANELGVKLMEASSGKLKVEKILAGMKDIECAGKVIRTSKISEFVRKDGTPGKVGNILIGDDTGTIRIVMWGSQSDVMSDIKEGDIVSVVSGYARENNGRAEIHLNDGSEVKVNPEGVSVGEVKESRVTRKKIVDLSENENDIELLGTIVQVFEPRFFEVCPDCRKRARPRDGAFHCEVHGSVEPTYSYVMNAVLDDGTETIRGVFFSSQIEHLLQKTNEEIMQYREQPETFDPIKSSMLGSIIKLVGRVTKNSMFDRLEFMARLVIPNPDPAEELTVEEKPKEALPSIDDI